MEKNWRDCEIIIDTISCTQFKKWEKVFETEMKKNCKNYEQIVDKK